MDYEWEMMFQEHAASKECARCAICNKDIDFAELCEECAKDNDPFPETSKYRPDRY